MANLPEFGDAEILILRRSPNFPGTKLSKPDLLTLAKRTSPPGCKNWFGLKLLLPFVIATLRILPGLGSLVGLGYLFTAAKLLKKNISKIICCRRFTIYSRIMH